MNMLRLVTTDDVGVALVAIKAGEALGQTGIVAREAIQSGHKIALRHIFRGEEVRKYGASIGRASTDILPGAHVHTHNLDFVPSTHGTEIGQDVRPGTALPTRHFQGFKRSNGRFGTRNHIGILTSVNCSATVAKRVASAFQSPQLADYPHVDGVSAFSHSLGCGGASSGEGFENLQRTLAGYATHPNLHSVVIVGLGCEVNQLDRLMVDMGLQASDRIHMFNIQDLGGTARAIEHGRGLVQELLQDANACRREDAPISAITLGLQCGGSDGWSGITANPALGAASDALVAHGGTAILSETPEIYGAEHLLLRRAKDPAIAQALIERLAWWQDYAARHGASLDNNPSPGNKAGGLTNILEKSLGAIAKSGTTPLNGVYRYGQAIDQRGFVFMDSPGYDPCSATGQIAAGANLLAFTTGRGSVFGSKPTPCIKLASNAALARHMDDDIDIDGSTVLSGESLAAAGARIFETILATASGQPTKSEALGLGDEEFVPWAIGATF
ncbi:MAG: hypothetical protein RL186_791 [Pseudomonadota bacterium]|jgi:altronate hydrolase